MDPSQYEADYQLHAAEQAAAAKRKRTLLIVAVFVLPLLYWGMGFSTVHSYLEEAHFKQVEVSAGSTPMEYRFKAKRDVGETCRGTVTRLPFSMSHTSSCQGFVDRNGNPIEDPRGR